MLSLSPSLFCVCVYLYVPVPVPVCGDEPTPYVDTGRGEPQRRGKSAVEGSDGKNAQLCSEEGPPYGGACPFFLWMCVYVRLVFAHVPLPLP
jgi:hypothetical protein